MTSTSVTLALHRSSGHDQIAQLLHDYNTHGIPNPRPSTTPTHTSSSHEDGNRSPISTGSGFNSLSSVAESEGRLKVSVAHELDASAKVRALFLLFICLWCVMCKLRLKGD